MSVEKRQKVIFPAADATVEEIREWENLNEPILKPSIERLVGHSDEYPEVWEMAQTLMCLYWTPNAANLTQDVSDWKALTDRERSMVERIHAFFATADGIVNANIRANFLSRIQTSEHTVFYETQIGNEAVHKVVYSNILKTLVTNPARIKQLISSVETDPLIEAKAAWAFKYMDERNATFADQILAFVCVEGIQFCASFLILFYFRDRGLLPGLTAFNAWIARDETLHAEFGAHIYYSDLLHKSKRALDIVDEAVVLECAFVRDMLGEEGFHGLPTEGVCDYVKFCADRILRDIGMEPVYNTKNIFSFMQLIGIDSKASFFERRVVNYVGQTESAPQNGETVFDASF